jgi:hypothetical protein
MPMPGAATTNHPHALGATGGTTVQRPRSAAPVVFAGSESPSSADWAASAAAAPPRGTTFAPVSP